MDWNAFQSAIRSLPVSEQQRIERAFKLCIFSHEGQKRKSGAPYCSHPIAVAHRLTQMDADADTIVAALLHDALEDTPVTVAQITKEFGATTAALVDGVTKLDHEEMLQHPTLDQEIESLRKIFTAMEKDVRIMVIKIIDRLHNMQTIQFLHPDRQKTLAQETMDIYVKIADRLSMQDVRDELEGLCLDILDPENFRTLQELRQNNEQTGKTLIAKMTETLRESAVRLPTQLELGYEHKTWKNLRAQTSVASAATGLSTLTVVFLCDTIPQCYEMLGILHQQWPYEILSFKDFINAPAINGYKGVHTTIILPDGTRARCKIRTLEMHAYARKGITTLCFQKDATGILDTLSWTQRISPLSKGTEERSREFWDSLQSDILGRSIMIYGPDDITVQLPIGATTLDGIFYLFGRQGLRTRTILVNGVEAGFGEDLPNGCILTAEFSRQNEMELSWLTTVQTGIATSFIREGLAKIPTARKVELGRTLLGTAVKRRTKVELDELDPVAFGNRLKKLGYNSLSSLFEKIAEGKVAVENTVSDLFPEPQKRGTPSATRWTLSANYPSTLAERMMQVTRSFPFRSLTSKQKDGSIGLSAEYQLSGEEPQNLSAILATILRPDQWSFVKTRTLKRALAAAFLLVLLWGLDPVFASLMLRNIPAYDLTVIRFGTFFVAASVLYASQKIFSPTKFKPLSPFHPALILSATALFVTALSTYLTLSHLQPTQYILFIIGGLTVAALVNNALERNAWWWRLLIALVAIIACMVILGVHQGFSLAGLFFAVVSALSFALYSRFSSLYQRGFFHARYPAYLFWLSVLLLPFTLPLLSLTHLSAIPLPVLLQGVLFVLVFSILPYGLYYECMKHIRSELLDNALPFVCLSTIIGQILVTGSLAPLIIVPVLLVFLWQYASVEHRP